MSSVSLQQVKARFAEHGLEHALDAFLIEDLVAAHPVVALVALSDLHVDADSGVDSVVTAALLTESSLIMVRSLPGVDAGGFASTATRVIPLSKIVELRTVSTRDDRGVVRSMQVEIVTSEMGDLFLEMANAMSRPDNDHGDVEDVFAEGGEMATVFVGESSMNSVILVEQESMSGAAALEELRSFVRALASRIS